MKDQVQEFINQNEDEMYKQRRMFHRVPEVGFTEYITTYQIYQQLKGLSFDLFLGEDVMKADTRLGVPDPSVLFNSQERAKKFGVPDEFLDMISSGMTGVVARLDTGREGKHVALRFDIDGLPITESKDEEHLPHREGFHSTHSDEMHACGHDAHITIGLQVAQFIHEQQDKLTGTYTLIFQPAEEGGRGAKAIVDQGWLDKVDYFLSSHVGVKDLPVGTLGLSSSQFLASTKMDAEFRGKSAHAGLEPNEGQNALLAASATSLHLNGITRHKDGTTRINVGTIRAGSGRNIIADYGKIEFETRGETTVLDRYMEEEARRIVQATGQLYNVETNIEVKGKAINVACDEEVMSLVERAVQDGRYVKNVVPNVPLGASEDVTFMIDHVQQGGGKATFTIVPSPLAAGHHHPRFDFDERTLPVAIEAFLQTIIEISKS
ncbi:amidohydrolase [Alkalibacillus aidingensis]|uniref:amidohydrolase n=1 Tax=Alkalibacillus aidingensis TaxID=2747607 RepID=UPI0016604DEE|nr:amidohydrolase [Alkalibacillus aidingensis]